MKFAGPIVALTIQTLLAAPSIAQVQPTLISPDKLSVPVSVSDVEARAKTKPVHAKKIILVGDSTMQVESGWGGAFCAEHVTLYVSCVNLARGGRSTLSYRAEGSWKIALNEATTPGYDKVYIFIQFGHNDQPGKPGNSTDLATEFPDNLKHFVTEARAVGAIPVLITPLTRRSFVNGSLQDTLQPWADSMKAVAQANDVPLVDLHAISMEAVQRMGPVAALAFAQKSAPSEVIEAAKAGTTIMPVKASAMPGPHTEPQSTEVFVGPSGHASTVFDYTHLGKLGAEYFSKEVTFELAKAVPDLRSDLVP